MCNLKPHKLLGWGIKKSNEVIILILFNKMETIRFASLQDFEDYARKWLDKPTFEHLRGVPRPEEH